MKRILALLVILDGITTASWGSGFLQWARPQLPRPARPIATWFLRWPEILLRLGATFQAMIGWLWLRKNS